MFAATIKRTSLTRFDPVKLSTLLDVITKLAPGEFVELTIHRDSPVATLTAQTVEQNLTGAIYGAAKRASPTTSTSTTARSLH